MTKRDEILVEVNRIRLSRLLAISRPNNQISVNDDPPPNTAGMYWFYTNYSLCDLKQCRSSPDNGASDIGKLSRQHDGLPMISTDTQNGFLLVYNGIAGYSMGLRKRIHQHFNGGNGTGCLGILKSSLSDITRWRISYVSFYENSQSKFGDILLKDCELEVEDLERLWRLSNGWPLLCKR